jgi:TIR domain
LSYSHDGPEHERWVSDLATRLRQDGIETVLDQWEVEPSDHLPEFMEKAVRENDFVVMICTPRYKERLDQRIGGVGYEGDIITSELLKDRNHRKFKPVLRSGDWYEAAPSSLNAKAFVDLRGEPYPEEQYRQLRESLLGTRPKPPSVGHRNVLSEGSPTRIAPIAEKESGKPPVPSYGPPIPNHLRHISELRNRMAQLESELEISKRGGWPHARMTDRVGSCFKFDKNSNQLYLLILNSGPQADSHGVFSVLGLVSANGSARLNCRWTHTHAVRARLARGESAEIFLAELKWQFVGNGSAARWEIYAASESGPRTLSALNASMATPEVHRAADIVLSGQIFADPETAEGPMRFKVILAPFGPKFNDEK